jgi:hypothetical protein
MRDLLLSSPFYFCLFFIISKFICVPVFFLLFVLQQLCQHINNKEMNSISVINF